MIDDAQRRRFIDVTGTTPTGKARIGAWVRHQKSLAYWQQLGNAASIRGLDGVSREATGVAGEVESGVVFRAEPEEARLLTNAFDNAAIAVMTRPAQRGIMILVGPKQR